MIFAKDRIDFRVGVGYSYGTFDALCSSRSTKTGENYGMDSTCF